MGLHDYGTFPTNERLMRTKNEIYNCSGLDVLSIYLIIFQSLNRLCKQQYIKIDQKFYEYTSLESF